MAAMTRPLRVTLKCQIKHAYSSTVNYTWHCVFSGSAPPGPSPDLLASLQSLGEHSDHTLLPQTLHQVCVFPVTSTNPLCSFPLWFGPVGCTVFCTVNLILICHMCFATETSCFSLVFFSFVGRVNQALRCNHDYNDHVLYSIHLLQSYSGRTLALALNVL